MKKVFFIIVILFGMISISSCSSSDNSQSQSEESAGPTEAQIKLSTTVYTYDTLIDDLIQYCCTASQNDSYDYYLYTSYKDKSWLAQNTSVESLIDKTLIEKMRDKKISSDSVYHLAMTFPNSWGEHKKLVVYDEIYKNYHPLFINYLEEVDNDKNLESKVTSVIKSLLRDPESFYMDKKEYVKYSWSLYVRCYKGDTLYYVDDEGKYNDKIYFYVRYHAKNGFGGYNYSGIWLTYDANGYVSWTGNSGTGGDYGEYDSGYNLYGDNQNLDNSGCVYIHN